MPKFLTRFWLHDMFWCVFYITTCFWRHDELFDVMTTFLTSWRTFLTSWRVFDAMMYLLASCQPLWRNDALVWRVFDVMTCFWSHEALFEAMSIFWRYDAFFGFMPNFLTSWRTLLTSWRTFFMWWRTFDVMTHFLIWWRTFRRHDALCDSMTDFSGLSRIFDVIACFWRHNVLLTSWRTFWLHDALFDVMTNFLTS